MTATATSRLTYFTRGVPPPEAIPSTELAEHAAALLSESPAPAFQYAPLGRNPGDPELRAGLAALHGADPAAIFVGNGSLQVLDLLAAHLLAGDRRDVLVEAPTYDRAIGMFARHGARLAPLPLEPDGIDVDALARHAKRSQPAFVYLIPDFQNPTGVTTGEAKRREIASLAARHGFPVVEDVPYRELRYRGEAPPPIAALAEGARVITVASLSKLVSPGLRVGYAISDPPTTSALAALAEATYLSPAPLLQAIGARCLAAGLVEANVGRVRALLGPRRDAAVEVARRHLGDALLAEADGGYYIAAHVPAAGPDELAAEARREGVVLTPGNAFYPPDASAPRGTQFVRLPFQALEPEDFATGVRALAVAARRTLP